MPAPPSERHCVSFRSNEFAKKQGQSCWKISMREIGIRNGLADSASHGARHLLTFQLFGVALVFQYQPNMTANHENSVAKGARVLVNFLNPIRLGCRSFCEGANQILWAHSVDMRKLAKENAKPSAKIRWQSKTTCPRWSCEPLLALAKQTRGTKHWLDSAPFLGELSALGGGSNPLLIGLRFCLARCGKLSRLCVQIFQRQQQCRRTRLYWGSIFWGLRDCALGSVRNLRGILGDTCVSVKHSSGQDLMSLLEAERNHARIRNPRCF